MRQAIKALPVIVFLSAIAFATIFGSIRGIVHDPQHRPIQSAHVVLKSQTSDWTQSQDSNSNGEFEFTSVPIGNYTVTVTQQGFQQARQQITVHSDTSPVLHFPLAIAGTRESVSVSETPDEVTTQSVTPTTMIDREDIQETPGADRTNGMEMITDYVPGSLRHP